MTQFSDLVNEFLDRADEDKDFQYVSREEYQRLYDALLQATGSAGVFVGPKGGVYFLGTEWIARED